MPIVKIPQKYICPFTQDLMKDPVIASDGYYYEREEIEKWLKKKEPTSPFTRETLEKHLTSKHTFTKKAKELGKLRNKLCGIDIFVNAVKAGDLAKLKQLYYSEEYLTNILDIKTNITLLDIALTQPTTDVLELFIADGFSLETKIKGGKTALHLAAAIGNAEAITVLLNARPSLLKQKDTNGLTALHWAAMNGDSCFDACKALIDAGADIDAKTAKSIAPVALVPQQNGSKALELFSKAAEHKKKSEEITFHKNTLKDFFEKKKQKKDAIKAIEAGFKLTTELKDYLTTSDLADSHYCLGKIYFEFARNTRERLDSITAQGPVDKTKMLTIPEETKLCNEQTNAAIVNLQSALNLYKKMLQNSDIIKIIQEIRVLIDEIMTISFKLHHSKFTLPLSIGGKEKRIYKAIVLNNFSYLHDLHEQYPNCIAEVKLSAEHPLNMAIINGSDREIIIFLIEKAPQQLQWRSPKTGANVLDIALIKKLDAPLIELIINKSPADGFKYEYSLVNAIENHYANEVIALIIKKLPNNEQMYGNRTPFDIALEHGASLDTLKHISYVFPNSIPSASLIFAQQPTRKNPLATALARKAFEVAEYLLEQYPYLLYLKDQNGKLPLQSIKPADIPAALCDKIIEMSNEIKQVTAINIKLINTIAFTEEEKNANTGISSSQNASVNQYSSTSMLFTKPNQLTDSEIEILNQYKEIATLRLKNNPSATLLYDNEPVKVRLEGYTINQASMIDIYLEFFLKQKGRSAALEQKPYEIKESNGTCSVIIHADFYALVVGSKKLQDLKVAYENQQRNASSIPIIPKPK